MDAVDSVDKLVQTVHGVHLVHLDPPHKRKGVREAPLFSFLYRVRWTMIVLN